ncbi:HAD-like domain-containing protein [Lentinula raphanica]|nr:HAD-like domain-containing protein [Lentinula raphanica]
MSLQSTTISTIIFDIGDVLCTYTLQPISGESPFNKKLLKNIISSTVWEDYEKGLLSEEECYQRAADVFHTRAEDIRAWLNKARESLVFTPQMISILKGLKLQKQFRLVAMSNISHRDFQFLSSKFDFSIFDHVYTSHMVNQRKPSLSFYQYVLEDIAELPENVLFIDDSQENVASARSLGIHGIVFKDPLSLQAVLLDGFGNVVTKAGNYLKNNAGQLYTITSTGVTFMENFSQLFIYELTGNREIVMLVEKQNTWNFFHGQGILTDLDYPNDLDTTSLALTVMDKPEEVVQSVIDEILKYCTPEGIVMTYFDYTRSQHHDPIVCVNVLTLLHCHGQGHCLPQTLDWVYDVLVTRAYLNGTRYYACGEIFLYFLMRFLKKGATPEIKSKFIPVFTECIQEHLGMNGNALKYAIRILVSNYIGIYDYHSYLQLLNLQQEDGSWGTGWLYKYGKKDIMIGNCGLTTALAMKAITVMHGLQN